VPTRLELAVLVATGFVIACATSRSRRMEIAGAGVVALAVAEIVAIERGAPSGVVRVTVLDVGQGDSLLVDLPDGKLMLVDGGGFVGAPSTPGCACCSLCSARGGAGAWTSPC
jgi:competence protein ComEC